MTLKEYMALKEIFPTTIFSVKLMHDCTCFVADETCFPVSSSSSSLEELLSSLLSDCISTDLPDCCFFLVPLPDGDATTRETLLLSGVVGVTGGGTGRGTGDGTAVTAVRQVWSPT